jgi:hypothetical protein
VGGARAKPPPPANIPTAVTCTVPASSWAGTERLITTYMAGNTPGTRPASGASRCSARPDGVEDGFVLTAGVGAEVGNGADVGVADDVDQPEWTLHGRHLDEGLQVDVAMADVPAPPVAVGVHLRMRGGLPGRPR